jgi:hypothetical protein
MGKESGSEVEEKLGRKPLVELNKQGAITPIEK